MSWICDKYQKIAPNFNPRDLEMIADCQKSI